MTDIITDLGEQKLALAFGSGSAVEITHVALGDGNGQNYEPEYTRTALRNERARQPIASRYFDGTTWVTTAIFPPVGVPFRVREVGFLDQHGDLVALSAGEGLISVEIGLAEHVFRHVLDTRRVRDGLIVINAPDDDHLRHALSVLAEQASTRLQQFRFSESWFARFGTYPEV